VPPAAKPSTPAPEDQDPARAAALSVDGLSYEQARDELVSIVARLEAGGETLEGSLRLWERGEALAARCQEWLDGARTRLDAARGPARQPAPPEEEDAR
jgi:exodeoxyribonuclease VII small subunit